MTIIEITALRKAGKLDEALQAAENEFALNDNNYTASALFWCLNDVCKKETELETIASLYERMKSLYEDYCSEDDYMPNSLIAIERRLDPLSEELKDAIELAKHGSLTDDTIQKYRKLFVDGNLNDNLFGNLGWLIYYNLKNLSDQDATKKKQLLHYYLKLELSVPGRLHSLVLGEALKIKKNTPHQLRIRDFMNLWGWDNLRPDDWVQFQTDNGNTVPSLVEKLISAYANELKTDNAKSSDEFNTLVDNALTKFPKNQNMPLYKARVLISLGKKDQALKYYKELILKSPSKCYLWDQASALLDDLDLKIALLCKAISVERNESFIGGSRLNLAEALIDKGLLPNAKYELEKYRIFYISQNWSLKPEFHNLTSRIPEKTIAIDNHTLYDKYIPKADEFIYSALPSEIAIKIEDRQLDDKNRPGRKLTQWVLKTRDTIIKLKKPHKFGLENRTKNGTVFNIRLHDNRIVWLEQYDERPQVNWLKYSSGTIKLRKDRNNKTYAILNNIYISGKLLQGIEDGQNVEIKAILQDDGRWSAISLEYPAQ